MDSWRKLDVGQFSDGDDWKAACVSNIDDYLNKTNDTDSVFAGLVDRTGQWANITNIKDVWGINVKLCYDRCGWDKIQTVFSFQRFSAGATNYLLPWLALTAQLPFETGEYNVIANIMSFCMALGSPMLITYSLMTTILNQHWLRAKFRGMETAESPIRETVKNARVFLQESQQVPLRLSQEDGSLGSLIVLSENKVWWKSLSESVLATRRGVTLSLVAQIMVALMSWVLTVVAAFLSSLGNPTEALVLASGSLWVWLVPIICGWITVGTQNDHSTIAHALDRDNVTVAGPPAPVEQGVNSRARNLSTGTSSRTVMINSTDADAIEPASPSAENGSFEEAIPPVVFQKQKGFRLAHQRNLMEPLITLPATGGELHLEETAEHVRSCFGFSIAGDEKQEGPTFNYARVFTWWHVATQIHDAFEATAKNLHTRKDLTGRRRSMFDKLKHKDLKGDSLSVLQYCELAEMTGTGVEPRQLTEYPAWKDLDAAFWQRIVISVAMALFVQWGSTSAALMIGYLTEVVGLGCRSGSYIVYGVVGTTSFALLFASSIFSHAAMLQHQATRLTRRHDHANERLAGPDPGSLTCFRVCAVLTRVLGRVLVVFNSAWIILISLWELIGFFNNCWCDGVSLSKGDKGFIILFKDGKEMAQSAQPAWAGGVFLSVFVVAASSAVFWLFCRGNRR
ncbi:hypothetical protein BJ170DRAFT_289950 [Xylariales sp. AK1849]|nr:hypothetical protein BJ170DRAFT_289950 [Xylariales sp. AK1849]